MMALKPGRRYGIDWKLSIIATLIFWTLILISGAVMTGRH